MNGQPIPVEGDDDLRLGNVVCNALMATLQNDKAKGTEKLKRFNLASKIQGEDDAFNSVELTAKQMTMIEDMCEQMYGTLVYARVYEALEGNTDVPED